jgi:hypothetical protein
MARQKSSRSRAKTPEAHEQELSALAYDVAEEQMRNGNASSQVLTHFLKMGSTRERLEQQRMAHEIELMEVKKESLERQQHVEELFTAAIDAMKSYSGSVDRTADAE